MANKNRHIVRRGGKWANIKEGTEKASSLHKTQSDAEQAAKKQLAKGGEVRIHGQDGNIKDRSSARVSLHKTRAKPLQRMIKASVYRDEEGYYVAECFNIAVATQGSTIEEALRNLQEAVSVHLEGADLEALGLAPNPAILVTMELEPAVA